MERLKLKEEALSHVREKILPFWMKLRDEEQGGYYGYVDYDLKVNKRAVKGCILNSRILWFFSNACTCLKDPSLLSYATHAYKFLRDACLDYRYGGLYWSVTYDGQVEDGTKHIYNQAFAVYALASYYEASKDPEAIETAWKLFSLIEEKGRDEGGYLEAFEQDFETPAGNEKLSENGVMASRTMNTLLHVFEAYTELYRVTKDPRARRPLEDILELFAGKIYRPDLHRQEVFFDRDWNSLIDLHSYGHDIETSWLVDRGCEVLGDPAVTARILPITKDLADCVYRKAYHKHSLWNEREKGTEDKTRVWWVQAEAVVGFLNAWEKEPERTEYLQAAQDIWAYIKEYVVDKREGSEWFWDLNDEGRPESRKPIAEPWKCPYHNGRMCFEIIRRLS